MTPDVAAAFQAMPAEARAPALALRALVFETAAGAGMCAPEETLKWGEPAYLPGPSGTTVRIGADRARPGCKLLVHCGTRLVEDWRTRFGERLSFEGNRAILVGADHDLDRPVLATCIADAFFYHARGRRG